MGKGKRNKGKKTNARGGYTKAEIRLVESATDLAIADGALIAIPELQICVLADMCVVEGTANELPPLPLDKAARLVAQNGRTAYIFKLPVSAIHAATRRVIGVQDWNSPRIEALAEYVSAMHSKESGWYRVKPGSLLLGDFVNGESGLFLAAGEGIKNTGAMWTGFESGKTHAAGPITLIDAIEIGG